MGPTILRTKLFIPPLRTGTILRPRLTSRLDEGLRQGRRLSLISAPAGYGKTSLVVEWLQQSQLTAAWLSLDRGDNDPARFWVHLLSALRSIPSLQGTGIGEAALAAFQSPPLPDIELLLTGLLNELADLPGCVLLVLDDLHLITEAGIHAGLLLLLEHLPAAPLSLHLVVASRSDPPWPMARLRACADLTELRSPDLRFKWEEAQAFLIRTTGLPISEDKITALEKRTEGWIAGLQMAALSLEGREDVEEFIRSFTGSDRYIFDYLMEEVLSRQEQDVQEFLLKTSILERLSAPLCNAILGRADSRGLLDRLEKSNSFLIPLDDERIWYRYHFLFADLLSSTLKQSHAEMLPELHRRACAWFEENDFLSEALAHALTASDLDHLAKIVQRYAFTVMRADEASSLLNWLNSLPESVTSSYPWLNIARSWLLAYLGMNDHIETAIAAAEKTAGEGDQRIKGYIAAMRTLAGEFVSNQTRAAVSQARLALELLPQDEFRPRAFVCYHLANILSWQGDSAAALEALEEASALSRRAGDVEMMMTAQFEIANILRHQGKLKESFRVFERTHQLADAHFAARKSKSLPVGFAYLQQAQIHLEWNDLAQALRLAQQGLRLCKLWGYSDYLYNGWIIYASILNETGDLDGASNAIREAKQIFPTPDDRTSALEALINQARGDWTSTTAWLSACGMSVADIPDFAHRSEYFLYAVILEEQGKPNEAFSILERLQTVAEKAGAFILLIKILVQEALIANALGEEEQALRFLQRALQMAEPEGFILVFLNKGARMEQLLRIAVTAGISINYARRLLEEFAKPGDKVLGEAIPQPTMKDVKGNQPPIEPLSDREIEVLRLLTTSLNSTEIATRLFISVSTVRTHIKNIYRKLNVNRRMQAVERARALKLL